LLPDSAGKSLEPEHPQSTCTAKPRDRNRPSWVRARPESKPLRPSWIADATDQNSCSRIRCATRRGETGNPESNRAPARRERAQPSRFSARIRL